jgi:hypothetical protein
MNPTVQTDRPSGRLNARAQSPREYRQVNMDQGVFGLGIKQESRRQRHAAESDRKPPSPPPTPPPMILIARIYKGRVLRQNVRVFHE